MNLLGKSRTPFFFLFDFDLQKPVIIPLKDWDKNAAQFKLPDCSLFKKEESFEQKIPPFQLKLEPISYEAYKKKFEEVKAEILYGNSYLLNLTQPTRIELDLSLKEIFFHSEAMFKLLWKDDWVVFSPERFVRIENGRIFTHPMKGTINAALPNAGERILNDQKEKAEHYTIVDLLRNDLNRVALRLKHLCNIFTIARSLFPISSTNLET